MISLGINANYAPENKQLINLKRFLKDLKAQQTTSNGLPSCRQTRTAGQAQPNSLLHSLPEWI